MKLTTRDAGYFVVGSIVAGAISWYVGKKLDETNKRDTI